MTPITRTVDEDTGLPALDLGDRRVIVPIELPLERWSSALMGWSGKIEFLWGVHPIAASVLFRPDFNLFATRTYYVHQDLYFAREDRLYVMNVAGPTLQALSQFSSMITVKGMWGIIAERADERVAKATLLQRPISQFIEACEQGEIDELRHTLTRVAFLGTDCLAVEFVAAAYKNGIEIAWHWPVHSQIASKHASSYWFHSEARDTAMSCVSDLTHWDYETSTLIARTPEVIQAYMPIAHTLSDRLTTCFASVHQPQDCVGYITPRSDIRVPGTAPPDPR